MGRYTGLHEMNDYLKSLGFTRISNREGNHDTWIDLSSGEFISYDNNSWHWGMICGIIQDWPCYHYKRFKHLIKGVDNFCNLKESFQNG